MVPADAVSFTLLQEQLHSVLDTLSEREAGVVAMRFGLTDGQPKTLDEIGKVYGVTRERIRQIESKTMSKLRHPSRSQVLGTTWTKPTSNSANANNAGPARPHRRNGPDLTPRCSSRNRCKLLSAPLAPLSHGTREKKGPDRGGGLSRWAWQQPERNLRSATGRAFS